MKRITQFLLVSSFLAIIAAAGAQNVSGPPAQQWGTYQRNLSDTIDLGHIQVGFTVPVVNAPERSSGLVLKLALGFGSVAWKGGPGGWVPSGTSGDISPDAPLVGQFSSGIDLYQCDDGYGDYYFFNVATGFDFVDPAGVERDFGNVSVEESFPPECDPSEDPGFPVGTTTVTDGQGWTMVANVDGSASFTSPQGVTMSGWDVTNQAYNAVTFVDRNGNEMSESRTNGKYVMSPTGPMLQIFGSPEYGPLTYAYSGNNGVAITYGTFTLATNFQCPGIPEYNQSALLPTKVTLLDGSFYLIGYEQTPNMPAGDTTGRITSLQIPAGATINYTYPTSQPNDDINCGAGGSYNDGNGRTLEIDRQTPGGTTKYVASTAAAPPQDYTTLQLTTITDPSGNQTVDTFAPDSNYDMVKSQVYTGSSSLLYTEDQCYNMSVTSCDYWFGTSVSTVEDRITLPNGMMRDTSTSYCGYGTCTAWPLEVDESSWYASGSPVWARKTITDLDFAGPMQTAFPRSTKVEDGSGNVVAETDYAYDQSQPVASGATDHQTGTNFGNLTTITYRVSSTATLTKTIQYCDTGEPYLVTDVNGLQAYTDYECNDSLPEHVWRAGQSGYDATIEWDCGLEAVTSETDANGAKTSWQYGMAGYALPTQITHPDNSVTNISYTVPVPGTVAASTESVTNFNGASDDEYTVFDTLGRTVLQQKWNGANWDTVTTAYNSDGLPGEVSAPFAANKGSGSGASAFTTTSYDGAARPLQVTGPTGGWTKYTYTDNDVFIERGPKPAGELNTKRRQLEYDGLGRLTSVCEVTNTLPGYGTCGQTVGQPGYWTEYGYSLLDKITSVTQTAQAAQTSWETRSFSYDELGRMTAETTPESGPTAFTYDSDCGVSSNGDLITSRNANGDVLCREYDSRHRLIQVAKQSGPDPFTTENFVYDSNSVSGYALSNPVGRLVEAYTGSAASKVTDEVFSYNVNGQVADYYQSSPDSGGYYHASETYFPNGLPGTLGIPGAPTITYGLDTAGRPFTVSATSGQNPVTGVGYSPLGLTSVTLGSADTDSYGYNDAGEMTGYGFNVNGQNDSGTLNWNADGSLGQLAIADGISGSGDSQICNYLEDDLGRLESADCGNQNQTFTYDAFGNMRTDATAGYSFSADFNLHNQISNVGGVTPTYDAAGDLTEDPVTLAGSAYDAAGRPVNFDGAAVVYDALGRAVEAGGHELEYAPSGAMIALMSGQTQASAFVPLPGGGTAVYSGGTLAFYQHGDWQGSARLMSTPARGLYGTADYTAFGLAYDIASDASFTGQPESYGVSNQYNFPMRNLSPIQGRWWTPDPAGAAAANPAFPQTWNAYAYVNGDPLEETDPTGMWCLFGWGTTCEGGPTNQDGDPWWHIGQHMPFQFGHTPVRVRVERAARKLISALPSGGACGHGIGAGVIVAGAEAEAGVGAAGASAQGSLGVGGFLNTGGASVGTFDEGGTAAYAGPHTAAAPAQLAPPTVLGASAGAGAGAFVTNAGSIGQLSGPFETLSANLGALTKLSAQFSFDSHGTFVLAFTYGPGVGASGSAITTGTATHSLAAVGCKP